MPSQGGRQVGVENYRFLARKISISRERVHVGRCVRRRLTELDELYKIKH
jgi:hypothetical protein